MKKVKAIDAAIIAAGGGLMYLGGVGIRHPHDPGFHLSAGAAVAGAGIMVYGVYRVKPSWAAAVGAVLLTAGYVNEHRRRLGLPELFIPGVTLPGTGA